MATFADPRVSNFPGGLAFEAFQEAGVVGTGAPQNVAHGLDYTPTILIVTATAGHDGAGAAGTQAAVITATSANATNVVFTGSAGATFQVTAF